MDAAVVTLVKDGVGHAGAQVIGGEIERDASLVINQRAIAQLNTVDGEIKKALHRRAVALLLDLGHGLVGGAVRICDEMDDGALNQHVAQPDFARWQRDELGMNYQAINVRVGHLVRPFQTVDGHAAGLKLQLGKVPDKLAHLHPASRDQLQLGNNFFAHPVVEGVAGEIPGGADEDRQNGDADHRLQLSYSPLPLGFRLRFLFHFEHEFLGGLPCLRLGMAWLRWCCNSDFALFAQIVQPRCEQLVNPLLVKNLLYFG